jgi:hypothetical protein
MTYKTIDSKGLQYFGEAGEAGDVGEYFGDDGDICAGAGFTMTQYNCKRFKKTLRTS